MGRQKQQEAFEKIGAVEQQAELRSAEASRRLGALDLRMSGVQGGLGEHKRDILKLRERRLRSGAAPSRAQCYSILGEFQTADPADRKRVFRALTLRTHPDKGGDADTFRAVK